MIADNKEWEKMFVAKKDVHFLDLEDRSRPQHGRFGQRRIISRREFVEEKTAVLVAVTTLQSKLY